ncbi:MAG: lipid-A-disaccharide synthase [Deltaproteobacteria bacterium]|nr:lipid-A-disaccharide synthase [Deltaproteobacteria bacterium]
MLEKPSLAILIDYPDFNLRLAQKHRRKGVPVLYYISPQVWAWRKRRVHFIRKWVTKMLVVFPFEVPFYQKYGVGVDFVGHPLLDHVRPQMDRSEAERCFGLDPQKKTIGLLPGSRKNEVHYLLGPMVEAALKIYKENSQTQFLLPVASTLSLDELHPFLKGVPFPIRCVPEKFYDVLHVCDVVVCCSGTATLETALFGKPMVILYKLNWLSYLLGRVFIRNVQFFGMPNIILEKKSVPELLQSQVTGEILPKKF